MDVKSERKLVRTGHNLKINFSAISVSKNCNQSYNQSCMKAKLIIVIATLLTCCMAAAQNSPVNPDAKLHKYSKTVERERPELNEETKALIAAYQKNPCDETYYALKKQVEANYDAVIARKKAKLEELRQTARTQDKVDEMEEIVNEVVADKEHRIAQTMARFTDPRMRPGGRVEINGYLPLIGAGSDVYIARAPVTNMEYSLFNKDYSFNKGCENHPATNVSLEEAIAYCKWLSEKDGKQYRLPTEDEWELAAGHMPKDADFNCRIGNGLTSVEQFSQTKGACGGIDFWGNCWEWTSTVRNADQNSYGIKGGSWDSGRMSCRTEYREESRIADKQYANVGFRILMIRL